jgi:hypothetical protein
MRRAAIPFALLLACSSPDDPAGGSPDGGSDGAYVPLLTAPWTMAEGTEGYWCARVTVPEDMWITAFRPIAPLGTHHTALSIDTKNEPDGVFPCEASTIGLKILFGSGVGTAPFELPGGVAYKLSKGERLLLNLHLYNIGEGELVGTSGVEVMLAAPHEVVHEAETLYAGTFDVTIPPGEVTLSGACTLNADSTIFGVFPHMHQLGVHMKGIAAPAGGAEIVLHDQAYDFESQLNHHVPLVELREGDQVRVECTYHNDTGQTVGFGDSSDKEMCFLGLYRYPIGGGIPFCFN